MSQFKRAVQEMVRQEMKGTTHSVMGYIPKGTVPDNWTTTVRIPHPHGGIHPMADESQRYLEFKNVPMPYNATGVLVAIRDMFYQIDRQVSVGFRGGSLTEPYIIDYQSPLHEADDKAKESTPNRHGVAADRAKGAGGCHTSAAASPAVQAAAQQAGVHPSQVVLTSKGTPAKINDILGMVGDKHRLPAKANAVVHISQEQANLSARLADPLNQTLAQARGFGFTALPPKPAAPAAQEIPAK